MYGESTGHKFILVVIDAATNYLVTILLHRGISHEIGETLINYVFCKNGPLRYLIFDEDHAFLWNAIQYI